jgi:hypothetical protein
MTAPLSTLLAEPPFDRDFAGVAPAFLMQGRNARGQLVMQPANLQLAFGPRARPVAPPLISCLMPTRGRFEQAKFAVTSFRRQTWPNRELVVLDQNRDMRLAEWIWSLADPAVRVVSLPGASEPLGALRNLSIDMSSGDLICVWDDDDLQHPLRLELAFAAMSAARVPACLLAREIMWVPGRRRVGLRRVRPFCNSLLTLRTTGLRYPPLTRSEDVPAVHALLARHAAVALDLPQLYVYIVHGANVSIPGFLDHEWSVATDRAEGSAAQSRLAELSSVYPFAGYVAAIQADLSMLREPQP